MTIRMLFLFCFTLFVGGCGGSSSSTPSPVPTTTVSGVTFDAPIQNGLVKIYSFASGLPGAVLGTGATDPQGKFSISIQSENQPILVAVTGGSYIEEASGKIVQLQDGQALYAVQNFVMSQSVSVAVSYYTTLATGYAEYLVGKGTSVSVAVDQANAQFSNFLAFDVLTTQPLDITDVANATPWLTAGHEYGFSLAALSGWTLSASRTNGVVDHELYNSIRFIQAAYGDIRADGLLDGKGSQGPLSMGVVPLTTRAYRHELAIQALGIANSSANHTTLSATQLVDTAKRLNDSTAAVFGSDPVVPLDEGGPVISNLSIANGASVSGVIVFSAQISSVVPLTTVAVVVDSGTAVPGDVAVPSFTIDTHTLPDGVHTLAILATDVTGVSANSSIQVLVDNAKPKVYYQTLPGSVTWYGVYTDSGSGIDTIWFTWSDGVVTNATLTPTSATGGNWVIPRRAGNPSWTLQGRDRAGNYCTPSGASTDYNCL